MFGLGVIFYCLVWGESFNVWFGVFEIVRNFRKFILWEVSFLKILLVFASEFILGVKLLYLILLSSSFEGSYYMCFIHTDFVGTEKLFEVHRFLEPMDEAAGASRALVCRPLGLSRFFGLSVLGDSFH